jgi:hypothetical protein
VNRFLPCAALSALSCLCLFDAAGCRTDLDDEAVEPAAPPTTTPSEDSLGRVAEGEDAAAPDDPDAPTEVAPVAFEPWQLELPAHTIDDVVFAGPSLYVAARNNDGLALFTLTRAPARTKAKDGQAPPEAAVPTLAATVLVPGRELEGARLVTLGPKVLALWVAQGQLLARELGSDQTGGQPGSARPSGGDPSERRLAEEEGGQFTGPLAVAAASDGGFLACMGDQLGPSCIRFDANAEVEGVFALPKRKDHSVVGVTASDDGFVLVLGACRGNVDSESGTKSCARIDLQALLLAADGAPGKTRAMPVVQVARGIEVIPSQHGALVLARRVAAGEHSAWRVDDGGVRELDGRFSRAVGGFYHDGQVRLVERSHLRMRGGFPVRGFELRALEGMNGEAVKKPRRGKDAVAREAFPPEVAKTLPADVDQTLIAHGDALVFAAAPRRGTLSATALRLGAKL